MQQSVVTSAATAVLAVDSGCRSRSVIVQNRAGGDVYFGGDTVTADDAATGGHKLADGESYGFVLPPGNKLYVIGQAGPVSVVVMEQA